MKNDRAVFFVIVALLFSGSLLAQTGPAAVPNLYPDTTCRSFVVSPQSPGQAEIYAATNIGVFRSTTGGRSWAPAGGGLTSLPVQSLAVSMEGAVGGDIYAGTYGGGVFRTANHGQSWQKCTANLGGTDVYALACAPVEGGGINLFAGVHSKGVFLSTDKGDSWKAVNNGLLDFGVYALLSYSGTSGTSYLFAGTNAGVFRSTNNGTSWEVSGLTWGAIFHVVVVPTRTGGADLFAGMYVGMKDSIFTDGVFRSTDNGSTWTEANGGPASVGYKALAASDSALFITTAGSKVFKSIDRGGRWTDTGCPGKNYTSVAVCPNGSGGLHVLVGTYSGGIFLSSDYGATWVRTITGVGSRENEGFIPRQFSMSQNFPNPFNPTTMIRYGLPGRSYVTLIVFDMLGHEVATLQNGEQGAGLHEVRFDATNLPSGVYFYQIRAGVFTETRKLLVLR
jgi:hypothetical protein